MELLPLRGSNFKEADKGEATYVSCYYMAVCYNHTVYTRGAINLYKLHEIIITYGFAYSTVSLVFRIEPGTASKYFLQYINEWILR